jgi:hypothetical protein
LVLREVSVEQKLWKSNRLLDHFETGDSALELVVDGYLKDRSTKSLQHVFNVLSLILPVEPLRIAYQGLHTEDAVLRGTALEYLESALPRAVKEKLWPLLEVESAAHPTTKSKSEILNQLLESNASIVLRLEELRKSSDSGKKG